MNKLKEEIKSIDAELKAVEDEYTNTMLCLPNLLDPDLVFGGKENNKAMCYYGGRTLDFEPKNHVDLCTELGLIDYERGAKLAGNGYWLYRGMGSRLEWALLNYFIETHELDGYEIVLVPHMLGYECGLTAGQFPKFKDEVYWVDGADDAQRHFMLPTAETALASLHRDEILNQPAPRRGAVHGGAPQKIYCIYPLLPPRSRFISRRGARHDSWSSIQQGRDVPGYNARRL